MLNLFTLNFIGSPVHLDFLDLVDIQDILDVLILLGIMDLTNIPDYPKIVALVDSKLPKPLTCGFE